MRVTGVSVSYIYHRLEDVIISIITNNLGYSPNRDRLCTGNKTNFVYIDCRGLSYDEALKVDPNNTHLPKITTTNPDIQNLHWHLMKLDGTNHLPLLDEWDRRLPFRSRFEYTEIELPDDISEGNGHPHY